MAEQSRELYQLFGSQSVQEMEQKLNFILNRISDRLDQQEGLRGNPTFYKNIFDFLGLTGLAAGQVLKATSSTRAEVSEIAASEVTNAVSDLASGTPANIDISQSLISVRDYENDEVIHQIPADSFNQNSDVQGIYTHEDPSLDQSYGDVTGPGSAVDNNLAQFNGTTGKSIEDSGLSNANVSSAISLKHTQGTDTALGAVGTKNPPIDADKAIYRDSTASDALVTSTWTQVKAFLKTYFDTLYNNYVHPNHSGDVTSVADGAQTIAVEAVTYAKMQHVSATDKVLGRSSAGAGDVEEITCTAAGRALLDDANAAAQATTLGLGTTDGPTHDHIHITNDADVETLTSNGAKYWASAAALADDATIALPTITANYSAHGFVEVSASGVIAESAEFEIDSTGTCQIIRGTANMVVNADTDGKFCLGTAAAQNPMSFKNRLAASKNVMITLWYA